MRILLLTYFLTISFFSFAQTEIDNYFSIKFPERHSKLDTIIRGERININYVNNDIEAFSVAKLKIDSKENALNDLPYNLTSLDTLYQGIVRGQRSEMENAGYKFDGSESLEIDGFMGYHTKYVDPETNIKNAEFIILILNEETYVTSYISHIDFDNVRKENFFKSIKIDKDNNPSQFLGEPKAFKTGYVFGKFIIYGGLILFVVWLIRRMSRK